MSETDFMWLCNILKLSWVSLLFCARKVHLLLLLVLYLSDVGVLYLIFSCACIVCNQGAAKVLIFPVVQQFTEAFVQALQMPDGPTSDSGFKMEVLKVSHFGLVKWRKNWIPTHTQMCWEANSSGTSPSMPMVWTVKAFGSQHHQQWNKLFACTEGTYDEIHEDLSAKWSTGIWSTGPSVSVICWSNVSWICLGHHNL